MTCDRCHRPCGMVITSYFNTDAICLDCKSRERAHPRYQEAVDAEVHACKNGDFNFPGIGLPPDLIP